MQLFLIQFLSINKPVLFPNQPDIINIQPVSPTEASLEHLQAGMVVNAVMRPMQVKLIEYLLYLLYCETVQLY